MIFIILIKEYQLRHALAIIFVSLSFWGLLWKPIRGIEAMGISALWVVALLHLLPAIVLLPAALKSSAA